MTKFQYEETYEKALKEQDSDLINFLETHEKALKEQDSDLINFLETHEKAAEDNFLETYKKALQDQDSVDVAYGRVMFLGSAGVGKTALKRSLMGELFDPNSTSTIISDVSSVHSSYRSFEHEWQTMMEDQWREVTEEDEIEEIALLMEKRNLPSDIVTTSEHYPVRAKIDSSTVVNDQVQNIKENKISTILRKAASARFKIKQKEVQPFLHIWNCGGQPVFLEILPAFFTPRTMFLVLFDASKNLDDKWQSVQNLDGQQSFEEEVDETTADLMINWMSTIHGHLSKHDAVNGLSDFPRLYCIGTHGDKLTTEDKKKEVKENLQSLCDGKAFFDLIEDILIVDNTTSGKGKDEDSNITKLRNALGVFVRKKLIVKTPVNFVLFRKVLQSLEKNVISLNEAHAIGVACDIPAPDVPKVLMFYHEVGAVLFYPHLKGLRNKVIINPKWFVNTLGKVFTLEGREEGRTRLAWSLLREKGILVQPLYVKVWEEYKNDIDPEDMMELLESFHLAAQVHTKEYAHYPTAKQYFLPAILKGYRGDPSEAPPGHKQRATPLHITFITGFVPPGFFTRLATTMAEESTNELVFDYGIYRNRVTFLHGQLSMDHLTLTDLHTAIQVDLLRYVSEGRGIPSFNKVCQGLVGVLNKCCQKVKDTLYSHHGEIIDQSYHAIAVNHEFNYVCGSCNQSDDLHYLKPESSQTSSLPVHCQISKIFRPLTPQESVWFKTEEAELEYDDQVPTTTPTIIMPYNKDNILHLLSPYSHLWEKFGDLMKVPLVKIDDLKASHLSDNEKLNTLLQTWLQVERTWEEILQLVKESSIGDIDHGIALKIFNFDFLTNKDNLQVVTTIAKEVLNDTSDWEKLGESLGIEEYTSLQGSDMSKCQQIISIWFDMKGASETAKELSETLQERIALEEAFSNGSVTVRISKAVVQGPARAGKTSVKCLITGEQYVQNDSTGVVEAPKIAINKFSSSDGGVCWKSLNDDEVLNNAVCLYMAQCKDHEGFDHLDVVQLEIENHEIKSTEQNLLPTPPTSAGTTSNARLQETASENNDGVKVYSHMTNLGSMSITSLTPEHVADDIMKKAKIAIKSIKRDVEVSDTVCKDWLYFIDSGGQIQYQQLLHAFLPCASLLLLVTNLAEDLSDPSSTKILHKDQVYNVSDYSLKNEELLERIILLVDSCCQKQREAIESNPLLKTKIKIPRLNVIGVATHVDDLEEDCKSKGISCTEVTCKKQESYYDILSSNFESRFFCPNTQTKEALFTVNGLQAKIANRSVEKVITTISEKLRQQAFQVEIPLRWYVFELLLRKIAKSFHGIFSLDICRKIGRKELNMKPIEVKSALNFFHLLNTLLYYPKKAIETNNDSVYDNDDDLVFIQLESLFEIITELTILICKLRKGERIDCYYESYVTNDAHRAIFPEEFLSASETVKIIIKHIPQFTSNLLLLFERLRIAIKIKRDGVDKFFVPALLPLIDPEIAVESTDKSPYVFIFEKCAPIGFFCQFIIHLLSSGKRRHQGWIIPSSIDIKFYSNCLTLRWKGKCDVKFIEYRDRYEIYSTGEHRLKIREDLDKAMKNLPEKDQPLPALKCPCSSASDIHFAEILEDETEELFCQNNEMSILRCDTQADKCWSWLTSDTTPANVGETLTLKDIPILMNEVVAKASAKWKEVGIQLGIDNNRISTIELENPHNYNECFRKVLLDWETSGKPPFTWKTIADVLDNESVCRKDLAAAIRKKHLNQM